MRHSFCDRTVVLNKSGYKLGLVTSDMSHFNHLAANLSKFLNEILTKIFRNDENSIKDSNSFAKFIKNFEIFDDEIMVSLDIVNLFTNIPIDYTLNLIKDKLNECEMLRDITNLSINEILLLLRFCMKNTIFKFNNKVYHQIFGAPMGSSLSPIIAEILVQYIFKTAIKTCRNPPRIVKFFVDDSFLIIKKRHFQYFFTHKQFRKISRKHKIHFRIRKQ